jgi:hypothetical protein
MASSTTVKGTYSLPPAAVRALEQLAARQGISKSEALARAILAAEQADRAESAVAVLDELQRRAALTAEDAEAWIERTRDERRAWVP